MYNREVLDYTELYNIYNLSLWYDQIIIIMWLQELKQNHAYAKYKW